ncbi:hypothetical protein [Nakamurella sp.]|uniref:hypothetical protein n=1 Tax=Nakamurella sp. TaxID=1869182 RepID=UPI00378381C2
MADLTASRRRLAPSSVTAEQFVALDVLRAEPVATTGPPPTPLELADREAVLPDWLADRGMDRDWVHHPGAAAAGRDVAWCEQAAAVPAPALGAALEWVAQSLTTELLLGGRDRGTRPDGSPDSSAPSRTTPAWTGPNSRRWRSPWRRQQADDARP